MRILLVNTMKGWGGGERQTYLLLKGLTKMGIEASLLCRKNSLLYRKASLSGLSVIGVKNRMGAFLYLLNARGKYDLVHTNTGKDQDTAVIAKLWTGLPLLHTRRTDTPLKKNFFTRWKFKNTDRVIAVCSSIKEDIEKTSDCPVSVIYSSIEIENFDEKPVELPDGKIVGTVASLVPLKDPWTLVRAARIVLERRKDVTFLHFGDGPLRKGVEKMIQRLGISERFRLMGFREEVFSYFKRFDVFVITSLREGLCNSVLDAFIRKIPVVSTDAGGLKEIVKDRGILCPVKDHFSIAQGILKLLEDESLRKELTEKAYQYVLENHNVDGMVKRYIEIYKSLLPAT
jgi:glycosyltransferase involved in cell wall biosynthesis